MVTQLEITPMQVREKLDQPEADLILLDCRETEELQLARLEDAVHIPMGEIPGRLHALDAAKEIMVFCHHGMRSALVAEFLRREGFANVWSMQGGIDAWSIQVDASVPRYG